MPRAESLQTREASVVDQDVLLVERRGETDWVTLNRPERLNALNQPLSDALLAYFEARRRDTEARVIVLAGAGRAFSSGADLKPAASRTGCATGRTATGCCATP